MSSLKAHWKSLLAALLFLAAFILLFLVYLPGKAAYENECAALNASISDLRGEIAQNQQYAEYEDTLSEATEALQESRLSLYQHFPAELLEEDQILYILSLEERFGIEIDFDFGTVSAIQTLSDGVKLNGLSLTLSFETTYETFREMVYYLSTDSRVASIQCATVQYNSKHDAISVELTLLLYTLKSEYAAYDASGIKQPATGKSDIFD